MKIIKAVYTAAYLGTWHPRGKVGSCQKKNEPTPQNQKQKAGVLHREAENSVITNNML